MLMLPLAKVSVMWTFFAALWVLLALGLVLIVLIQKGRGGGISAAFGGGGANSLLGTKTGDFLTWVTIGLVTLLLVGAVVMGKFMRPQGSSGLVVPTIPMEQPAVPAVGQTDLAVPAGQADDAATEQTQEAVGQATETMNEAAETAAPPAEQPAGTQN